MAYLIGQLTWWLVAVGAAAAVSGWALHLILNAKKLGELEKERDRLRGEFLGFFHSDWQPLKRSQADDRELDTMRTRVTLANAHAAALERAMGELRDRRDELLGRIAELERALEGRESPDLQGEVSRLQGLLDERPDAEAMNALAWRLRYFEARTKYLESGGRLRESGGEPQAAAAMQAERDAAREEASELRTRLAEGGAPPGMSDAVNSLSWRARYLDARVRYLEGEARPKSPAADPETIARRDWRSRYVERRVRHLQNELKAARIDAGALAAARERIGELEAASSDVAPEGDVKKLRWRERYLDARVRHLEQRLTGPGVPLQATASQDGELPIETPQALMGGGVRPASIAAPRQGAPDDLTLIEGIGPKTEKTLQALGVFHFDQIADWSRANCAWVDGYLRLRGRIERERWVEQARALARGGRQRHQLYLERELV